MNQLFVGIDVSSRDNAVYIMLPDGSKHSSFAVGNNLGGAQALSKRVVSALEEQGLTAVCLGMEATSVYGDNLACFLREDGALARFERKLHVLNPKQVKKFKDAYSDLPKNDAVDELAAFIAEKGKNRSPRPYEIAKAVQAAARGSYRLPKTVNDSVNQVLSISISSMRAMQTQIKALDKEILRQFDNIPNTLTSVPGIGPVFSAGIIAEIGDINRFDRQAGLAKYAGLAWTQHQSGQFEAQNTRLIKSGNRFLKYYLCEAANSLVRCDTEYRRYYDLKYKEVNKYQHKRALALTARKLVRLVFRLLKDNRLYIPAAD